MRHLVPGQPLRWSVFPEAAFGAGTAAATGALSLVLMNALAALPHKRFERR